MAKSHGRPVAIGVEGGILWSCYILGPDATVVEEREIDVRGQCARRGEGRGFLVVASAAQDAAIVSGEGEIEALRARTQTCPRAFASAGRECTVLAYVGEEGLGLAVVADG